MIYFPLLRFFDELVKDFIDTLLGSHKVFGGDHVEINVVLEKVGVLLYFLDGYSFCWIYLDHFIKQVSRIWRHQITNSIIILRPLNVPFRDTLEYDIFIVSGKGHSAHHHLEEYQS